ncbi:unnamed protein product [Fructobacillus cardui]|uniref:DUF4428 domain-containing protein n=1 Tax=Fructobacillus cardui TaxID=2893170 RepID=UPI002DA39A35|nr:unnamed protein product [Fructobacillus cardui]
MAKYCAVCEEKIGFGDSVKIEDGYIDLKCAKKVVDKPTSFTGQDIPLPLLLKK